MYGMGSMCTKFGEAFQCIFRIPNIISNIQSHLVSSQTTYACYLVYKLPKDQSEFQAPILVEDQGDFNSNRHRYIFLVSPQTPVIRPKADQNTHNPLNKPKFKGLPQERNDGWMEVQIWEFLTATTTETIPVCLALGTRGDKMLSGLIIEGVEFRPI
ncbi:putative phloem protein [Helianthus anomalus]